MSFFIYLQEKFKRIDILGKNLQFSEQGSLSFKTHFGAFVTLLFHIGIIVYSYLYGKEIWDKAKPISVTSYEYIPFSKINITDIPFVISLLDKNKVPISQADLSKLFTFEIETMHIKDGQIVYDKYIFLQI